ncbi:hypothetical protein [uncultured Flavobacterium sp.]|uniref:hypothetical protein n=1 Tax=uncultured Flavobacterium sp. TaxID=165435 RepID=UPI0030EC854D|tara:strand:- start:1249 stop:1797 length:549 start_codon:yes stop_codon:yes gene_type:complete
MKTWIFTLFLCSTNLLFSQEQSNYERFGDKITFTQFELSVPLKGNDTYGEIDSNGNRSDYRFVPDGISTKFGYGIHHEKWVGISLHSGIDWKITPKLVSIPVYAQLTLNPLLGDETRLLVQAGYGQSFAIGRGNLNGNYYKARLGITTADDLGIFIDTSFYGFAVNGTEIGSLSIGISIFVY